MPPKKVKSSKRKKQYKKIKRLVIKAGKSTKVGKKIVAATTNKTRKKKGKAKSS